MCELVCELLFKLPFNGRINPSIDTSLTKYPNSRVNVVGAILIILDS